MLRIDRLTVGTRRGRDVLRAVSLAAHPGEVLAILGPNGAAVANEAISGDVRLSVRFYPVAGKIDQAAGIAFGIAPDGSTSGSARMRSRTTSSFSRS